MSFTLPTLTDAQQDVITFWQAPNTEGPWFVSEPGKDGRVEVLHMITGDEYTTIWSLEIEPNGDFTSMEYARDEDGDMVWSTGITV